jgi:hypothetical protein
MNAIKPIPPTFYACLKNLDPRYKKASPPVQNWVSSQSMRKPINLTEKLLMFQRGEWQAIAVGDGSQSAADLAFCSLLALVHNGDREKMDADFRKSAMYRPKWDEQHGSQSYGAMTLAAALETFSPNGDYRGDGSDWRGIFHAWEEFEHAPPLRFAIKGFLQEAGVTLIGGLAGHGKTLLMLAMTKALLEQSPLFGYERFAVPRPAQRVLYLIPESSLAPFWSRLQLFRLEEHVRSDRLLISTLSSREPVSLSDPRMLKAAEGADVFLDTAVRFMDGSENDAQDTRPFVQTLFRLLHAGARSITGAHHAPKGFEGHDYMTLENILRGSGDIGAMLCTAWGVRQIDAARNQLYVQNVKPRDFQPCESFVLEARPHLDKTGHFLMIHKPGEAGELSEHLPRRNKGGRPAATDKDEKRAQAVELRAQGLSLREIEDKIGVAKTTVGKWLWNHDLSQKCPTAEQIRDTVEPDGETPN